MESIAALSVVMKLHIAATNPCHVYEMAKELQDLGALGIYYSGYPKWRLRNSKGLSLRTHSLRTCLVYGLLKFVPESLRPASKELYSWQDEAFDQWVARELEVADFLIGIPGQCREAFQAARRMGIRTVLSHATGPMEAVLKIMREEYQRAGLAAETYSPFDEETRRRHEEEYALADFHWVPSRLVMEQLQERGIGVEKIWKVPFGANPQIFFSPPSEERSRILFAGQFCLRKGIRVLLQALEQWGGDRELHCFGPVLEETRRFRESYRGTVKLIFHGPVSQEQLGVEMRKSSLLVLPSLEESFGLVVPQALSCGMACLVSDRVGAKDLIENGKNGEIVPWNSPEAWGEALRRWEGFRGLSGSIPIYDWKEPALRLRRFASQVIHEPKPKS